MVGFQCNFGSVPFKLLNLPLDNLLENSVPFRHHTRKIKLLILSSSSDYIRPRAFLGSLLKVVVRLFRDSVTLGVGKTGRRNILEFEQGMDPKQGTTSKRASA